jgi:hypothetical protein
MQSVFVPNWSSFTAELDRLRDELTENASGKQPELLFRGQNDSSWTLMTTLERADCEGMSFDEYYRLAVTRARPTIEAFTGARGTCPITI